MNNEVELTGKKLMNKQEATADFHLPYGSGS